MMAGTLDVEGSRLSGAFGVSSLSARACRVIAELGRENEGFHEAVFTDTSLTPKAAGKVYDDFGPNLEILLGK